MSLFICAVNNTQLLDIKNVDRSMHLVKYLNCQYLLLIYILFTYLNLNVFTLINLNYKLCLECIMKIKMKI